MSYYQNNYVNVTNVEPTKHQGKPGGYNGHELGRKWCNRPGCYDAFDKPSLNADGTTRPYKASYLAG